MKLLEHAVIAGMPVRNRILRSATWEALADAKGYMSEKQYRIYDQLAKNEVGLICTGYARVDGEDRPNAGMMGIYDDAFIPQYQELTRRVHAYGAKIMMQIAYGGTKTTFEREGRTIFSPSAVPERKTGTVGVAMSPADIQHLIGEYAQAAKRVRDSGFDAVEIHGGHSYLLNQFLSPYYNRRCDAYGGSPANRYRIVGDIIAAIRQAAGPHFPIWIKITCSDFFEGGLTFEDSLDICRRLQQSGIDAIEVSGNIHGKAQQEIGLEWDGHVIRDGGYFLDYAKDIADAVRVPVYVTGGFKDPRQMETALKTSKLAGIGLSRPLLSEPGLVRRWNQGGRFAAGPLCPLLEMPDAGRQLLYGLCRHRCQERGEINEILHCFRYPRLGLLLPPYARRLEAGRG